MISVQPTIASLFGMHMPPFVALLLTLGLIVFLFRRDIREKPNVSGDLWLPLLWFVISSSRGLSPWLTIFGLSFGPVSVEEGSPLDACFYFGLIAAGFFILNKRQVRLSEIVQRNGWIIAFLLYCFISIAWSDFPFVAFKRWIKVLGQPIMALIVLTEPDLQEGLTRLMKRCAYVVIPVSILFIKYYPQFGISYDTWTGLQITNGIAMGKNLLGADCMVLGFFFFWHFLQIWPTERSPPRRKELYLIFGFLLGICWLLKKAHSATSWIALFMAILTVLFVGRRFINKKFVGSYLVAALVFLATAELGFGLSELISKALGRGTTLTGRTDLWAELLKLHTNPIFGTGFESFWLGDRVERLGEIFRWHPNEAHNGYLDIYLTLGLIGLFILGGLLIATFWKTRFELLQNLQWGRYRLGFLTAVIVFNCTEAAIKPFHPAWFVFYIIALEYPRAHLTPAGSSVAVGISEESREFAYAEGEP
jgi:exopolysaccharide production protein ExoQ